MVLYLDIGIWWLFDICDLVIVVSQLCRYLIIWSPDSLLTGILIIWYASWEDGIVR